MTEFFSIDGKHVRHALSVLGWSAEQLSDQANIPLPAVNRVLGSDEDAPVTVAHAASIRQALTAAGYLDDLGEPDVRDHTTSDVSAASARETHDVVSNEPKKASEKRVSDGLKPTSANVKKIRRRLKMTQTEFADAFGFSVEAIKAWESGVLRPKPAATHYLIAIASDVDAVHAALRSVQRGVLAGELADEPGDRESPP